MKIEDRRTGNKQEINDLEGGQVFRHGTLAGWWILSEPCDQMMNLDTGALRPVGLHDEVWLLSTTLMIEDGPR